MTEQTKKVLLVIIFIAVTVMIAFLIYWVFFRPFFVPPTIINNVPTNQEPVNGFPNVPPATNVPVTNVPPTVVTPAQEPGPTISPIANGGITSYTALERRESMAPSLSNNGRDLLYYNKETGFFYQVTPEGEIKNYSDKPFKNVETVNWAQNGAKAVLEYPDGSNIVYDFQNDASVSLPKHWEEFSFSPNGNSLSFIDMKLDPENRFIATTDANGGNYTQLEQVGENQDQVHITWSPNNQYAALFTESISGSTAEVYPIGFNGENFRKFKVEGRDFRFIWSPKGDKLVYSVFNAESNYNPMLWVVDTSPENLAYGRNKLNLATWADKCVFANDNEIYCAVPTSLAEGSGFRPDLADNTPDEIYKVNINNANSQLVAQPLFASTIEKLVISSDGSILYWVDKNTGQINKINLK